MDARIHAAVFCRTGLSEDEARSAVEDLAEQILRPDSGPSPVSGPIALSHVHIGPLTWVLVQANWRDDLRLPYAAFDWHTRAEHAASGTAILFGSLKTDDIDTWLPPAHARLIRDKLGCARRESHEQSS